MTILLMLPFALSVGVVLVVRWLLLRELKKVDGLTRSLDERLAQLESGGESRSPNNRSRTMWR